MKVKQSSVKLKAYTIISEAIEQGIALGYKRAHKHTDTPSEDVVVEHIQREVMQSLADIMEFE